MSAKYDSIGIHYAQLRRPDPRFAELIHLALGPAQTVLNVGAGTGSYEPTDRSVTAVEPSIEMIRKREPAAAPAPLPWPATTHACGAHRRLQAPAPWFRPAAIAALTSLRDVSLQRSAAALSEPQPGTQVPC